MERMRGRLMVVLVFLAATEWVAGQETLTNGLMIDDSGVLGTGALELSGFYSDRVCGGSYGLIVSPREQYAERTQAVSLGAAYGISDGMDLLFETQWRAESRRDGPRAHAQSFGDLRVGLKVHLHALSDAITLSWIPSFFLPVDRGARPEMFGTPTAGTDQLLVVSGTAGRLASTLQLGMHYGYSSTDDADVHLHLAGGLGWQWLDGLQPRLEFHLQSDPASLAGSIEATAMLGVLLNLNAHLRLDCGLQECLTADASRRDRAFLARVVITP